MKFKYKLSDLFLTIVTTLAISLSIVLWIFVMTNDQRFSRINQSDNITRQQVRARNTRSLYDLYAPTNSYGFKNDQLYRLYDSKKNLSFEFSKELKKLKVKKISIFSDTQYGYERMLNNPDYIQLTYPDKITFDLFNNITVKKDSRQFSRIFISQSNHYLYLGNDQTNKIYSLKISGANFNRLRNYAKASHYKMAIKFIHLKTGYTAFYVNSEKWRVYSYLISHSSDSYFVARLLGTSDVSSRNNKKNRTIYLLNYYTKLLVPKTGVNNDRNYFYTQYGKNHIPLITKQLVNSIYYVHRLGLMEQDLNFFDASNNSVRYVNYIEGTPVFLNNHDVQIDVNFSHDAVTVGFNSTNFQIPIPFDGREVKLESTSQLISKLEQHGLQTSEIERVTVGFKVENDSSHNNLVNLIPTYYIKAYGEWKSAAEWMKQDLSAYQLAQ